MRRRRSDLPVLTPPRLRDAAALAELAALDARAHRARRLRPDRPARRAGPPGARRAQPPPLAPPATPRRVPDPGRHPRGRRRDGRVAHAHGRGPRHGPARRDERGCRSRGDEAAPELEARLADAGGGAARGDRSRTGSRVGSRPRRRSRKARRSPGRCVARTDASTPRRPAVELERQVRAYQPWPGSYLDDGGDAAHRLASLGAGPVGGRMLPRAPAESPGDDRAGRRLARARHGRRLAPARRGPASRPCAG